MPELQLHPESMIRGADPKWIYWMQSKKSSVVRSAFSLRSCSPTATKSTCVSSSGHIATGFVATSFILCYHGFCKQSNSYKSSHSKGQCNKESHDYHF